MRRLHDNFHLILAATDELLALGGGPALPPSVILELPAEVGDRLAEEAADVLAFQALSRLCRARRGGAAAGGSRSGRRHHLALLCQLL